MQFHQFMPGAWLANWYARDDELLDAGEISGTSASDRMQAAKQFLRWMWEQNYLGDLPRNINSREMTFSRVAGDVQPMPEAVLRRRMKAATGRMKLELLLMANCGMYQGDTADLLHTEVDWKAGTITRQRSKKTKGKEQNLPTVTWYLWPSTLDLLREHATADQPHVLANRNGVKGVRTDVRDDGTVARTDNARTTYDRLQDFLAKQYDAEIAGMTPEQIEAGIKAGELERDGDMVVMRRWSLKHIRKTGSTAIGNHERFSRFAQYFLGQAPETVAYTHYAWTSKVTPG